MTKAPSKSKVILASKADVDFAVQKAKEAFENWTNKPPVIRARIEDISDEKRMKGTMARYMDPAIADQLMATGKEVLGGAESEASILFSDVRSFTTLTESLGAQGTVGLLNEYFTLMVDCLQKEGGMLDKFIGSFKIIEDFH